LLDGVTDIQRLDVNADVVVLSACNPGGGSKDDGESLSGLARSFFYAGARSVMATHRALKNTAGAYLVKPAPLELKNDPNGAATSVLRKAQAASALRKAQLEVMGTENYDHPFSWPPMIVIGGGHQVAAPARIAGLQAP
jgi:CHAT domain-containing protein